MVATCGARTEQKLCATCYYSRRSTHRSRARDEDKTRGKQEGVEKMCVLRRSGRRTGVLNCENPVRDVMERYRKRKKRGLESSETGLDWLPVVFTRGGSDPVVCQNPGVGEAMGAGGRGKDGVRELLVQGTRGCIERV